MKDNNPNQSAADLLKTLADQKSPNLDNATNLATKDMNLLGEILNGLVSKKETYRYNCVKVLLQITEKQPQILYPHWDYFVELLGSKNAYHRIASIGIIANLTRVDIENRFENIFDQYFDHLDDLSMIVTIYLARNAWKIAKSKPHLQGRITQRLLNIDKTHHNQDRKDLIMSGVIQSFEEYFKASSDKHRILAIVEEQLECSSPKTRKMAKGFLDKFTE